MKLHRMYLVFLLLAMSVTTAWSAPLATYVAEFSAIGAAKPDEIKSTIQTLLLSRLASARLATQAKPEGAEIKISGSYLLSGSVFSLDAAATNSSGAVIARAFTQGKSPDELIPAVGTLAKMLSDGIGSGVLPAAIQKAPAAEIELIKPLRTVPVTGQAIYKMTGALNGLAVGKTMADGERELFVTGNQTLRYYRQSAELKLMAEIPYKVFERVLAVDSADLDNDGNSEIYVTVMNGEVLASQVWVVDGAGLKQLAGPLPYYFRAVAGDDGINKLYAQQISGTADFNGDVAEVVKSGSNYVLKNPLKLPKNSFLYNFNILTGAKGATNPVIIERGGYLKVFTVAGDELEKSNEEYGGSETHFKRTDLAGSDGLRQVFLEQRMIKKGPNELLVAKNSGSWFMQNKHYYSKNSLYCLAWNGLTLEEKWHTKPSDFYLADFAYDNRSSELLMLEVVAKEDGIFDKGASRLLIKKIE